MLSVVVIAKNEAHNLPRCLASVKDVADEVVVVDSGSTDGTPEVARAAGARVFDRPFTTYADQKNWAADQAAHPYILSLDADESLSPRLAEELVAWKREGGGAEVVAWSMPRRTHYIDTWIGHGGWYPDRKVRLWKAGTGSWRTAHPEGELHEAWELHDDRTHAVGQFAGDLLHHSYHTLADHHRQLAKFSTLGAADARRSGRTAHAWTPWLRAAFQWVKQAVVQGGVWDGRAGMRIARWSAVAAHWKWRQVRNAPRRGMTVGIARTDALGDTVLTLPLAAALRAHWPDARIVWIGREYVRAVVEACADVDAFRSWSGPESSQAFDALDAVVFAYPEPVAMRQAARAEVPLRVGTGRRWAGLRWLNRRAWHGRKRVPRHETLQGLRLLHALHIPAAFRYPEPADWAGLVRLVVNPNALERVLARLEIPQASLTRTVVLHPGNHGSANGWPLDRFSQAASQLQAVGWQVVITGTAQEAPALRSLIAAHEDVVSVVGLLNLEELLALLAHVHVVVASSTGPLHVASAVGTRVVGIYRSEAPFWPERWGPVGSGHTVCATSEILETGGLDVHVSDVLAAVGPCPSP